MSYSPATVARRFSILDGVTIQGVLYQIIWDPETPFAAVIEAAPSVIDVIFAIRLLPLWSFSVVHSLKGCLSGNSGKNRTLLRLKGLLSMALYVMLALLRLFMKQ